MMIATDVSATNALWLPTLTASRREREDPDDERRDDRHLAAPRHAGDLVAERQPPVARHREQQADARRLDRERAHGDRDRGVDEEHLPGRVAERLLDDVRQPERADVRAR